MHEFKIFFIVCKSFIWKHAYLFSSLLQIRGVEEGVRNLLSGQHLSTWCIGTCAKPSYSFIGKHCSTSKSVASRIWESNVLRISGIHSCALWCTLFSRTLLGYYKMLKNRNSDISHLLQHLLLIYSLLLGL